MSACVLTMGCPDGECPICKAVRKPKLPPGPAFIPPPRRLPWPYESLAQGAAENVPDGYTFKPATDWTGAGWVRPHGEKLMPGIAEFLAEGPEKLIIAELPDGDVMLTMVNTITSERHSITMRRTEAHAAALILRFATRSLR
jgi:hypothetical protein